MMRREDGPTGDLTVLKLGGEVAASCGPFCDEAAELWRAGHRLVVAHGGGPEIDRVSAALGLAQRRHVSPSGVESRVTDERTIEAVQMALLGVVKPLIVSALASRGVDAVGLHGADGRLLTARPKPAWKARVDGRTVVVRDGRSGRLDAVRAGVIERLVAAGTVPVVSPPALGPDGKLLNVNADRVAAALAVALGARRLLLLTNTPGVLADLEDERTLVPELAVDDAAAPDSIAGGMRMKVLAGREALLAGVPEVWIGDGLGGGLPGLCDARGTRLVLDRIPAGATDGDG